MKKRGWNLYNKMKSDFGSIKELIHTILKEQKEQIEENDRNMKKRVE